MGPQHPLVARLTGDLGYSLLDAAGLAAFCEAPGHAVLFCTGDPATYPETLDLAVVLPELMRAFPGRLMAGVAAAELEPALQARYGFSRWPSLVFLRDGDYLGTLSGILDWAVYQERIQDLLAGPLSRPPSIGIPLTASPAHCH